MAKEYLDLAGLQRYTTGLKTKLQYLFSAPLTAATAAAMTDTTRVYVYTGSEDGYSNGHWYYYDGDSWEDGGVYQAVAVNTDATLTQSGEAADAKATGDTIAATFSRLGRQNAVDFFDGILARSTGTSNGVTYTWSGDTCTVTGSASNYSANVLFGSTALPEAIIPGETYYIRYSTTNPNVLLRIIFRDSGNQMLRTDYAARNRAITIPDGTAKWTAALYVDNGVAFATAATVSDVRFMSALSNLDLQDSYMTGRGVIPDNSDLDDYKTEGHYVLQSGYTYTHAPASAASGGTLTVCPSTKNIVLQTICLLDGAVYARTSVAEVFSNPWVQITGITNNYNNTYESQHYENSYSITCSPSITTDTNNFLAATGDNTDRTGAIQTMLDATGVCHLGPGTFVVTGVEVPDYGGLFGSGESTRLLLSDGVASGYAVKLKSHAVVKNMRIYGSTVDITPSATIGTRHGVLFEGTADAETPTTFYRSTVENLQIRNFSGGGITCSNTGLAPSSSLHVSDVFIVKCGAGVNIPYYSEFHRFTNVSSQECYYGCVDNGGNNNFANCDFSSNKVALLIDNENGQSTNNSHGTFSACSFHHSDNTYSGNSIVSVGTAIRILGATAGELFTGCQIGFGNLEIRGSTGIRFAACNFMRMTAIEVTESSLVAFSDCTFYNANSSPVTQSDNVGFVFDDCYLRDGTAYNPVA